MSEFRVIIDRSPFRDGISMAFCQIIENRYYVAKPVELTFEQVPEGSQFEPTMVIGRRWQDAFLKSLAESLDQHGVKTESTAKREGTLEATKYHLADLRTLLKLK